MKRFCLEKDSFQIEKFDFQNDRHTWDNFLPQNHHLKSPHLDFYKENTSVNYHFFRVKTEKRLVGQFVMQETQIPVNELINYSISSLEILSACLFNPTCSFNILVCGNIFKSNQAGYYFSEGVSHSEIFKSMTQYLYNESKNFKFSGFIIKDCEHELNQIKGLIPYKKDVTMSLKIASNWVNMEAYVSDLDKKYRNRYKKILKSKAGLQIKELSFDEIIFHKSDLNTLFNQVFSKQKISFGKISADYFQEKKVLLGEKYKIYGFYENQTLIAFTSHIIENNTLEVHYIGFDYKFNEQYNLYFNILYHGLEAAISGGFSELELGRTAFVAKSNLGAKPKYILNYLYFRRHFYKISFKIFNKFLNSDLNIQLRNPFSNAAT